MTRLLHQHFSSLLREQRGSMVIMCSFAAFLLVMAGGIAVDTVREEALQSKIQTALDIAGFATAKMVSQCFSSTATSSSLLTTSGTWQSPACTGFLSGANSGCNSASGSADTVQTCMQAQANKYLTANIPAGYLSSGNITVTPTLNSDGSVSLTATASQKLFFMSAFGSPGATVAAASKVGGLGTPNPCLEGVCVFVTDLGKEAVVVFDGSGDYIGSLDKEGFFSDATRSGTSGSINDVTITPANTLIFQATNGRYMFPNLIGTPITHVGADGMEFTAISTIYGSTLADTHYFTLDSDGSNGGNGNNSYLRVDGTARGMCQLSGTNSYHNNCTWVWGVASDANNIWVTNECEHYLVAYLNNGSIDHNTSASPTCPSVTGTNASVGHNGYVEKPQGQTVTKTVAVTTLALVNDAPASVLDAFPDIIATTISSSSSTTTLAASDTDYTTYVNKYCHHFNCNGQFWYPWGVAVDTSGNIWVTDTEVNRVQKFDSNGNYLLTIPASAGACTTHTDSSTVMGSPVHNQPSSGEEEVTWTTTTYTSTICGLSSASSYPGSSTPGEFSWPRGIATSTDTSGNINVWVADSGNTRVEEFDSTGNYITNFGSNHLSTATSVTSEGARGIALSTVNTGGSGGSGKLRLLQ